MQDPLIEDKMNPVYSAANYFIEAINLSPNFIINNNYIPMLIQNAPPTEKEFLKNYIEDPFVLFKKFPDVFILRANYVKLTDAFLSVYALKKSKSSNKAIKQYHENSAISFFRILINQNGPQHFIHLFKSLLFNSNTTLSCYFQYFSTHDAYTFFLNHSNVFMMYNGFVSLNANYQEGNYFLSPENSIKAVQELKESVHFLLTCFESLHYIELKQCISYVSDTVNELLDSYSIIKQREIFESMPDIKMNDTGFLSLEYLNVSLSLSNDKKILLLFVCILAFETKVHFTQLIKNIAHGRTNVVDKLCNSSVVEQILYFERLSDYFLVSKDGFVGLKPSFICPICTFDAPQNSKVHENPGKSETSHAAIKSSNPVEGSNFVDKNSKPFEDLLKGNFKVTSDLANNGFPPSLTEQSLNKNARNSEDLTQKCNSALESNCKSVGHCNVLDKHQEISDKIMLKEKFGTSPQNNNGTHLSDSRVLQKSENEMKVSNPLPQLNMKHVDNSEFVNESSDTSKGELLPQLNNKLVDKTADIVKKCSENTKEKSNISLEKEAARDNDHLKKAYSDMFQFNGTPEEVKQRIVICILFLQNNYPKLDPINALKSILITLNDVKKHFRTLSEADRHNFVNAFLRMAKPEILKKTELRFFFLWEIYKEKTSLFIAYLLTDANKEIHFEKIVNEIKKKNITYITSDVSGQFKFFKDLHQLVNIYDDGYVSLSERFDHLDLMIRSYANLDKNHKSKSIIVMSEKVKSDKVPEEVKKTNIKPLLRADEKSMFKTLKYIFHLIKKTFEKAFFTSVLETFLIALKDVYKHFSTLPGEKKFKFIEDCYVSVDPHSNTSSSENCPAISPKIKEIILISYLIVTRKRVHYSEIVLLLNFYEVNASVCEKKPSDQFKYFKDFNSCIQINGDGFVYVEPSFEEIRKVINSVNAFMPSKLKKYQNSIPKISCNSLSAVKSFLGQISSAVQVNQKGSVINNRIVPKTSSSQRRRSKSKSRTISDSSSVGSDNVINYDAEDIIIDFTIFILSVSEEITVEKLTRRLHWCKYENVRTFFSSSTSAGKENFFKLFPQYFNVSENSVVRLKENISETYVPKTKLNISELFNNNLSRETNNCKLATSNSLTLNSSKLFKSAETSDSSTLLSSSKSSQTNEATKLVSSSPPITGDFTNQGPLKCNASKVIDKVNASSKNFKVSKENLDIASSNKNNCISYKVPSNIEVNTTSKLLSTDDPAISSNEISNSLDPPTVNSSSNYSLSKENNGRIVETMAEKKMANEDLSSKIPIELTGKNLKSHDVALNESYDDYISELIDSMLSNSIHETSVSNKNRVLALEPSVHESSVIPKNSLVSSKDIVSPCGQKSAKDSLQSVSSICNSVREKNIKSSHEDNISDKRAVNFFCVMLQNYNNVKCGVSIEFLRKDLCIASKEVQSYIGNQFKNDLLLFFLKHQQVFSVSPQSHFVSLLKE